MGNYKRFEDLEIWKEAMSICKEVYAALKSCKDYGFKDQMCRSAVSIPSNIAEGYECKGVKEAIQFLYSAKSSCGELRTQLYLAIEFDYLNKEAGELLITKAARLSVMIYNYIQFINKNNPS